MRDNIKVKLVSPEDAVSLYDQIEKTRPQLAKFMPWGDTMRSVEDERDFLEYCQNRMKDKKLWITSVMIDGRPVGMIDLHNIDLDNSHAEIGYWLGGEYQGNGVMTDCLKCVIEIGFGEMKLHKIKLLAEVVNIASNAVAKRAGFELEGLLKDEIYSEGEFHDANLYGLIN
ncbi:acetyltransferase [Companilactobacillus kimchiensis]|uniref:Acetyltransferase n=1 Tax=Companilactobacillus kimchiensis TaxID=993692 RepID=A0A0R2LB84_9LACO|nr:acetyltransferase [Companilactobacillus kimchiensis]